MSKKNKKIAQLQRELAAAQGEIEMLDTEIEALEDDLEIAITAGVLSSAKSIMTEDFLWERVTEFVHALVEIGLPKSVPANFEPEEWWRYQACKKGEIARDALGVTAEDMIEFSQSKE